MFVHYRLKKSSSPSRWLMGLPPTSPRFKFVHTTHPAAAGSGNQAVPRRPPRQPSSPSTRSRSLELLDQQQDQERKSISPTTVHRPPLPRPRSRSLDDLLDDDVKKAGGGETGGQQSGQEECEKNREYLPTNSEEDKTISALEESQQKFNAKAEVESKDEVRPVSQTRLEFKSETKDTRKDRGDRNVLPARPPKPSRCSNSEGQFSTSKQCRDRERQSEEQKIKEAVQVSSVKQSDNNDNDDYDDDDDGRSTTLLKTSRSCGAGLDSDGSIASSEYGGSRPCAKGQGSLLSLPAGAEPKRKRNFMDKCVNKVRSFMKK